MANLILPDPRMEMPELLEPGRKPIGPVEINWLHPISRNLEYCQLFQPDMRNIVNGRADTIGGNVEIRGDYAYFPGGTINDIVTVNTDFDQKIGTAFSVFAIASFEVSASANPVLIARGDTGASEWMFRRRNNNDLTLYIGVDLAGDPITTAQKTSVAFTYDRFQVGGEDIDLFQDGIDTGGTGGATLDASLTAKQLTIGCGDANSGRIFKGCIYAIFGWSRKITAGEIAEMHRHPYGSADQPLLIPA